MLATRAGSRMILPKDGAVSSACSFIQNKRFVVAMPICKEVSKAVHARQRVRMLRPEHLLSTAPASACSSIPPPRTCLGCPARAPSCSCSSACPDAQAQAPSPVRASVCLFIASASSYFPGCPALRQLTHAHQRVRYAPAQASVPQRCTFPWVVSAAEYCPRLV